MTWMARQRRRKVRLGKIDETVQHRVQAAGDTCRPSLVFSFRRMLASSSLFGVYLFRFCLFLSFFLSWSFHSLSLSLSLFLFFFHSIHVLSSVTRDTHTLPSLPLTLFFSLSLLCVYVSVSPCSY